MYAAFHLGYKMQSILFDNLDTNTVPEFVGACICIFVLCLIYESLKFGLTRVRYSGSLQRSGNSRPCHGSDTSLLLETGGPSFRDKFSWLFFEMSLYAVQLSIGYCVMLIVMMCNTYVFLIVIFTSGLSYAVFGLQQDITKLKSVSLEPRTQCRPCAEAAANHEETPCTSSSLRNRSEEYKSIEVV